MHLCNKHQRYMFFWYQSPEELNLSEGSLNGKKKPSPMDTRDVNSESPMMSFGNLSNSKI